LKWSGTAASVPPLRKEKGLEIKSFKCLSAPEKNQGEIVKRFEEGHTPAEIAGMLDLTVPEVEMILAASMNLKQEEIWLEAIKRDHNAILEIPKEQWTEKLCLAAVKKNYGAIYFRCAGSKTTGFSRLALASPPIWKV
jgi:hypothetical protein